MPVRASTKAVGGAAAEDALAARGHRLLRPLGQLVEGGLVVSQLLTPYITPVVYLESARDALRRWWNAQPA